MSATVECKEKKLENYTLQSLFYITIFALLHFTKLIHAFSSVEPLEFSFYGANNERMEKMNLVKVEMYLKNENIH